MLFDLFIDVLLFELHTLNNGIGDLHSFGTSVSFHHKPLQSKKRRAAVLAGIERLQGCLQSRFHEKCPDFAPKILHHTGLYFTDQSSSYTLIKFQDHIADKGFADNHITDAGRNISGLHAADEIDVLTFLQKREGLFHECVSFFFFRTDVDDSYSRVLHPDHIFHINGTHLRKLYQMGGSGIYVGSAVNQQCYPILRGDQRCKGRTLHAFDPAYNHLSSYQNSSGTSSGYESVCLAFFHKIHSDHN